MINPDHLLELVEKEVNVPAAGAPRQANLCRAISSAYCALFHELAQCIAKTFVGQTHWESKILFLRALEHGKTRDRCKRLGKNPLPDEESAFFKLKCFPEGLRNVANQFVKLQELRHVADYDPEAGFTKQEVKDAAAAARDAIGCLRNAEEGALLPFLSYLLFGLRR